MKIKNCNKCGKSYNIAANVGDRYGLFNTNCPECCEDIIKATNMSRDEWKDAGKPGAKNVRRLQKTHN